MYRIIFFEETSENLTLKSRQEPYPQDTHYLWEIEIDVNRKWTSADIDLQVDPTPHKSVYTGPLSRLLDILVTRDQGFISGSDHHDFSEKYDKHTHRPYPSYLKPCKLQNDSSDNIRFVERENNTISKGPWRREEVQVRSRGHRDPHS